MSSEIIYLDYAAATPLDERVFFAMEPYLTQKFYNPSAAYQPAREVKQAVKEAREKVAKEIGAISGDIIFTAGATESINLAFSVLSDESAHVVTSAIEHMAVLETAKQHQHTIIGVDSKARVKLEELKAAINENTQLISIGLVNNETGTIQAVREIAAFVKEVRQIRQEKGNATPLYLHTDASQAAGVLDLHVSRLGVDMMTLNSAKVYGPKQMGLLWAHSLVNLRPLHLGGGQERGLRSGTENVAGIIGFSEAFSVASSIRKKETERLRDLKQIFMNELHAICKDLEFIAENRHQVPHIFTLSWPGVDGERLLFGLESKGVLVATGSACGANKNVSSHVLHALNLSEPIINGSLRFSLGRDSTEKQMLQAAKIVAEVVNQERLR